MGNVKKLKMEIKHLHSDNLNITEMMKLCCNGASLRVSGLPPRSKLQLQV